MLINMATAIWNHKKMLSNNSCANSHAAGGIKGPQSYKACQPAVMQVFSPACSDRAAAAVTLVHQVCK